MEYLQKLGRVPDSGSQAEMLAFNDIIFTFMLVDGMFASFREHFLFFGELPSRY